jgi:hypothetical protein
MKAKWLKRNGNHCLHLSSKSGTYGSFLRSPAFSWRRRLAWGKIYKLNPKQRYLTTNYNRWVGFPCQNVQIHCSLRSCPQNVTELVNSWFRHMYVGKETAGFPSSTPRAPTRQWSCLPRMKCVLAPFITITNCFQVCFRPLQGLKCELE